MLIKKIWHKIKEMPFVGIPYQKYIGDKKIKKIYEKQSAYVKQHGNTAIEIFETVLSENFSVYFVDCGTLLGALRNHKFIDWDPDIDYGVVSAGTDIDWENLQNNLEKKGFSLLHEWKIGDLVTEQTYGYEKLTIDIFAHYMNTDSMSFYCYTRLPGKKYSNNRSSVYEIKTACVSSTREEQLEGSSVHVPLNAEEYIAYIYNDDWRVPNPNWVAFSGKGCIFRGDLEGERVEIKNPD